MTWTRTVFVSSPAHAMDIKTFLDAKQSAEGDWTFSLPTSVHGAFGGAFGCIGPRRHRHRRPRSVGPGGSAEAACLAADISVSPPLGYAMSGERVSTPNPDLSLRFCGDVTTDHVIGLARMERAEAGVA